MSQRGTERARVWPLGQRAIGADAQALLLDAAQAVANERGAAAVAQPLDACLERPTSGRQRR
jgi:hypothetical protein